MIELIALRDTLEIEISAVTWTDVVFLSHLEHLIEY